MTRQNWDNEIGRQTQTLTMGNSIRNDMNLNLMRSTKDKKCRITDTTPTNYIIHPLAKNLYIVYLIACISYKQAAFRMIIATKSDADKHAYSCSHQAV